ncbi:MAG: protoporphyrinogen oxidase HemJ [Pseudomonadota bacterium]
MGFLAEYYNWIKALHVVAFVAWMAGMFYLPRIFVYHHQATPGGEAAGLFTTMEDKLLRLIMTPSMIATWIFGLLMIALQPSFGNDGWFVIKFLSVIGMSGLHGFYAASARKFAGGHLPRTEKFWRMINEVPVVLLVIIAFMVVLKPLAN